MCILRTHHACIISEYCMHCSCMLKPRGSLGKYIISCLIRFPGDVLPVNVKVSAPSRRNFGRFEVILVIIFNCETNLTLYCLIYTTVLTNPLIYTITNHLVFLCGFKGLLHPAYRQSNMPSELWPAL